MVFYNVQQCLILFVFVTCCWVLALAGHLMAKYHNAVDLDRKLDSILRSTFRASFKLGEKDHLTLTSKGLEVIRRQTIEIVQSRLAPANITNDGHQTPTIGHPAFVAQHATATCCRDCLLKNHDIRRDHNLDQNQIEYIADIICLWLSRQFSITPKKSRTPKGKQIPLF